MHQEIIDFRFTQNAAKVLSQIQLLGNLHKYHYDAALAQLGQIQILWGRIDNGTATMVNIKASIENITHDITRAKQRIQQGPLAEANFPYGTTTMEQFLLGEIYGQSGIRLRSWEGYVQLIRDLEAQRDLLQSYVDAPREQSRNCSYFYYSAALILGVAALYFNFSS